MNLLVLVFESEDDMNLIKQNVRRTFLHVVAVVTVVLVAYAIPKTAAIITPQNTTQHFSSTDQTSDEQFNGGFDDGISVEITSGVSVSSKIAATTTTGQEELSQVDTLTVSELYPYDD